MSPAPKRRWFAYSLRTLFLVLTVVIIAFYLGWVGGRCYLRYEQSRDGEEMPDPFTRGIEADPAAEVEAGKVGTRPPSVSPFDGFKM
jgi:hypothetical protein